MTAEPPNPGAPSEFTNYRLGRLLGSGGMGAVYEATDKRSGARVAVKLLHAHLAADESYRDRFTREAHVASLLRSPYTAYLLDYGFEQERYFLVMRFAEGETMRDALRRGPLSPARALGIAAQMARALEEAATRGVVHRDIKPDNIMLTAGDRVQVLDFGIARQTGAATLTGTGAFIGTPMYAAPETTEERADHRSDLYSLGVTLYHMLTGQPPFRGGPLELLRQHHEQPVPREPLAGLRAEVVSVLAGCLEKDPADRYQSATELAAALEDLAEQAGREADEALAPATQVTATLPVAAGREPGETTTITSELGPASVRPRLIPRWRAASYDLVLRNDGDQPLDLRLEAGDGEECSFSLPDRVSLDSHAETTVELRVRPRRRRWRGQPVWREFSVSAADGGGPPVVASGRFEDRPEGWLPYTGAALFSLAVVVILIGGLCGVLIDEGGTPALVAPPGVETPGAAVPSPTVTAAATPTPIPTVVALLLFFERRLEPGAISGGPSDAVPYIFRVQGFDSREQRVLDFRGFDRGWGWESPLGDFLVGYMSADRLPGKYPVALVLSDGREAKAIVEHTISIATPTRTPTPTGPPSPPATFYGTWSAGSSLRLSFAASYVARPQPTPLASGF